MVLLSRSETQRNRNLYAADWRLSSPFHQKMEGAYIWTFCIKEVRRFRFVSKRIARCQLDKDDEGNPSPSNLPSRHRSFRV